MLEKRIFTNFVALLIILSLTAISCDMLKSVSDSISGKDTASQPKQQRKTPPTPPPPQGTSQAQKTSKKPDPNELARVAGWSITLDEFKERLSAVQEIVPDFEIENEEDRKLVLDELIRQQLLVLDAEQSGLDQDKNIKTAVEEFRRTLLVREMAKKLTDNVGVTDQEVRDFYENNKDKLISLTEYRVREIVVKDKLEANELLTELLKGASFLQVAKEHSISESADKGGDLGFITKEPFEEMGLQILKLDKGELSNVFEGPEGYYIVKLEDIKGGDPIPFEEISDELRTRMLIDKQQKAIIDHIQQLREKTDIQIREELLK